MIRDHLLVPLHALHRSRLERFVSELAPCFEMPARFDYVLAELAKTFDKREKNPSERVRFGGLGGARNAVRRGRQITTVSHLYFRVEGLIVENYYIAASNLPWVAAVATCF